MVWTSLGDRNIRLSNGLLEISIIGGQTYDFNAFKDAPGGFSGITDAFVSGENFWAYNGTTYVFASKNNWFPSSMSAAAYNAARSASGVTILAGSVAPSYSSASTPSGPKAYFETVVDMTGHQIVGGAAGVLPTDFVVVSQLTALSAALTTVINAGDAVNAAQIANLAQVVANLPAGLTMPTVQAAIDAAVANAVLNEVIDDAQKQALVDAALAQLSTIDTAVIDRVSAAEQTIMDTQNRAASLEAHDLQQDASIGSLEYHNGEQYTLIAAAAAAQSAITVNNAQNDRISQSENGIAMLNQITTPIEVKIVNGVVTETIGCALSMVSIDNSNTDHCQVSINLGSDTNGRRRVLQGFRLMPNGTERELGHAPSRNGEVYTAVFLKSYQGSTSVNFVLN